MNEASEKELWCRKISAEYRRGNGQKVYGFCVGDSVDNDDGEHSEKRTEKTYFVLDRYLFLVDPFKFAAEENTSDHRLARVPRTKRTIISTFASVWLDKIVGSLINFSHSFKTK